MAGAVGLFHVPGPTLAGPVILAPIMVAGAIVQRRGAILLTSAINGLILSLFVPIGVIVFPIYVVVGIVLELCVRAHWIGSAMRLTRSW